MEGWQTQRAIVAAWLLVKEASALLATFVEVSPNPAAAITVTTSAAASTGGIIINDDDSSNNTSSSAPLLLLSAAEIVHVGELLLDALGRLKHMGAIGETHDALQIVVVKIFSFAATATVTVGTVAVVDDEEQQQLQQVRLYYYRLPAAGSMPCCIACPHTSRCLFCGAARALPSPSCLF